MYPQFEHDCPNCIFLGISDDKKMDLYFCEQKLFKNMPTVIARFSDHGPDYMSGIVFAPFNPHIAKAVRLAKEQGLLKDE